MEKYQSPGIELGALVPQTAKSCDTGTRQQGTSVITTRKINGHREPELLFIEQEYKSIYDLRKQAPNENQVRYLEC